MWHIGLIAKLSRIRITGNLLQWFQNYLNDRQQCVLVNGQCSSWGPIKAGVAQESMLGLLLFLVYFNITFATESSEIMLFPDDTIMYLFVDSPVQNAEAPNHDLAKISNWPSEWLVKFSPRKTKTMIINRKRKGANVPPLSMNDENLEV